MNTTHLARGNRRARRLLTVGVVLVAFFGLVGADSPESFASYALVTAACILPSALWIRAGMPGIPILPAVAAFHYLYFAVPILRENFERDLYTPWEILRAAATVAAFLVCATLTSQLVFGVSTRRSRRAAADFVPSARSVHLLFAGLAVGLVFQLAVMSGWLNFLGSSFGVVRSVAMTAAATACYLTGCCRARGELRGQFWRLALAGIAVLIVLSWSSFYLVGGMVYAMAAVLGYVITAKRIPWKALAPLAVAVFVLHAGKFEMRDRYWVGGFSQDVPVGQVPGLMTEWVADGVTAIAAGEVSQDVIDRASLLYMLLGVQRLTPEYIPYLGGETYALLPTYLVPRFLEPNKTFSQAGLALLNIRYGIQTGDSYRTTTIGWGIIAEAFANFGYSGVLGVGVLFGALAGFFTRWSAGASSLALPTLLSVAALVSMINLEADLAFLLVNLWQALIATLLFFVPLKFLSGGEKRRPPGRAPAASRSARLS